MKTNKAKRYGVWFCESKNKGLSCVDYKERDFEYIQTFPIECKCKYAFYGGAFGTVCLLKQLNKETEK